MQTAAQHRHVRSLGMMGVALHMRDYGRRRKVCTHGEERNESGYAQSVACQACTSDYAWIATFPHPICRPS
jgi:hypothetical protein